MSGPSLCANIMSDDALQGKKQTKNKCLFSTSPHFAIEIISLYSGLRKIYYYYYDYHYYFAAMQLCSAYTFTFVISLVVKYSIELYNSLL